MCEAYESWLRWQITKFDVSVNMMVTVSKVYRLYFLQAKCMQCHTRRVIVKQLSRTTI